MDLLISIITSIATGIYAGLVVVRYAEFRNLREEGLRAVFSVRTAKEVSDEVRLIAQSLDRLGHKRSANDLQTIADQYRSLASTPSVVDEHGMVSLPTPQEAVLLVDRQSKLRLAIKTLKPSWLNVAFPF